MRNEPSAAFNSAEITVFEFFSDWMDKYTDPETLVLNEEGKALADKAYSEIDKAYYDDLTVWKSPIYLRVALISIFALLAGTLASFYFFDDLIINSIVATGAGFVSLFAFAWVKFEQDRNSKFPAWIAWLLLLATMGGMIALEKFKYPFFGPQIELLFEGMVDADLMDPAMSGVIGMFAEIITYASVINIFIPGLLGLTVNMHRVGSYVGIFVGLTCYLGGKLALTYIPVEVFAIQSFLFMPMYTLIFISPLLYGIVVTFIIKAINGKKKHY